MRSAPIADIGYLSLKPQDKADFGRPPYVQDQMGLAYPYFLFQQVHQDMLLKAKEQYSVSEACARRGPFITNGGLIND